MAPLDESGGLPGGPGMNTTIKAGKREGTVVGTKIFSALIAGTMTVHGVDDVLATSTGIPKMAKSLVSVQVCQITWASIVGRSGWLRSSC